MKNQLLNLKMIALMCLMMVLGGANVWAADKITSIDNIVSGGKYYICAGDGKGYLQLASKNLSSSVKGTCVVDKTDANVFIFEGSGNQWTIKIDGTSNYLSLNKDKDNGAVQIVSTATSFTLSNVSGGLIRLAFGEYSIQKNSQRTNFGSYKNTQKDVWLEQATPAKTLTSLAISGELSKKTYEVGEALNPEGLVVTGTYDDKSTATITDGITWAMNPATLSLSDVSCSVTATVNGVTSPAYNVTGLTVNEAKLPSTTDATFGPDWDKLFGTSYNGQISSVKANKLELNGVSNGVKIKVTNGTSTAGFVKTNDFRLYGNYTITITAPKDVLLSEITMTSQTIKSELKITENKITSNVGSVKLDGEDLKWIGSSNEIQFEFSDKVSLSTIKVATKAAAAEPTYTPATVNFVAYAGADYYATFSNANVVFMPSDVTISTVAVEKNSIVLCNSTEGYLGKEETVKIAGNNVAGYYIPANTGVLLNSKNSGEVTYYTVENKKVAAYSAILNNMLMPSVAGGEFTADPGKVYYKLAYNDYTANTGLGFYWGADNGGAFSVKAGTAYLAVPAGEATAKGFAFNGEATGIEGVNANVENAKAIYNLSGQRVASMAKPGLYIVNGKKVVRK